MQADLTAEKLNHQKQALRKAIRQKRRSINKTERQKANKRLLSKLKLSRQLLTHRNVALYIGNDGEICPSALIDQLRKWRRVAYLPVVHPIFPNKMLFCQVNGNTLFVKNRFGILEPCLKHSKYIQARFLSLVLMPLVAFDTEGNRLGMGGGFYDRSFNFKLSNNTRSSATKPPKLVGLAFEFQKVSELPKAAWDVPMLGIATDQSFYMCTNREQKIKAGETETEK